MTTSEGQLSNPPSWSADESGQHTSKWSVFDNSFAADKNGIARCQLLISGIHCASCTNRIESHIGSVPGVQSIRVNTQTGSTMIEWDTAETTLGGLLRAIEDLGFAPHPVQRELLSDSHNAERNTLLRRLAVAGLGMMQVTMFAVATYFDSAQAMSPEIERLLKFVAMLVATPVIFYSGAPFLSGALSSLRGWQPNMDVPVSLALILAYSASCINFFRDQGELYFESATMFVFLLLCARFISMNVRHRSIDAHLALLPLLPDIAMRIVDGVDTPTPRTLLAAGDHIRIRPGDAIAADGLVTQGESTVDEALLTGESRLCSKSAGDQVLAGAMNIDGTFECEVTAVAQDSRVEQMAHLLEKAQTERPPRVALANRVASWFVVCVLALASLVYVIWMKLDPSQAFSNTLAVLVVTCPCALALAIPTGLSAAVMRLARDGLLVSNPESLEILNTVNLVLFDKTGTLSAGVPTIEAVYTNDQHPSTLTAEQLLAVIASFEKHSNHPLAKAFNHIDTPLLAQDINIASGQGISGRIDNTDYRIGRADFTDATDWLEQHADDTIFVSDNQGVLGSIAIHDHWRMETATVIRELKRQGIESRILSGDQQSRVDTAVEELHLAAGMGGLLPEEKLAQLKNAQSNGYVSLAVGDGVNDAALLAGADASIAMSTGADLAKAGADIVTTDSRLTPLLTLIEVARQTKRTTTQNLAWAVGYNIVAVPLAAMGFLGPGLAALGMSLSSLIVVLNASRISRFESGADSTNLTSPALAAGV